MIQFQMFDHQPERCEKYHQMLKDNLPVLEGIGSEADFEKYGDSLGWFDIDTWANEAELSAIKNWQQGCAGMQMFLFSLVWAVPIMQPAQ